MPALKAGRRFSSTWRTRKATRPWLRTSARSRSTGWAKRGIHPLMFICSSTTTLPPFRCPTLATASQRALRANPGSKSFLGWSRTWDLVKRLMYNPSRVGPTRVPTDGLLEEFLELFDYGILCRCTNMYNVIRAAKTGPNRMARTCVLLADNFSENKNNHVVAFCSELVLQGWRCFLFD